MARKPGEKLPASAAELDGVTKAAIVLLAIGPDRASKILKEMPPEQLEEVTRELAGLGMVGEVLRNEVIEDFYGVTLANAYSSEGGLEYAKEILKNSL
ncbi:MAG: flagellar motor switch protein FliG, partial [Planctomycetes bacterium HGW-Planctomycetes-2]